MKSLKRLDIEALRKEMPVLEEAEERSIVGGSGSYLTWDPYANLTASSSSEKQELLNMLMGLLGYSGPVILTALLSGGNPTTTDAGVPRSGGPIYFNTNSNRWTTGNIYDIALILVHEKNHQDTSWNNGLSGSWNEIEAYRAEVMHPYFQNASAVYRSEILARASW
jgi:hypothetical protein